MTEPLSDAQLAAWEQLYPLATQHVNDLSAGRKRWRMCVPPQDDDSDLLLMNALAALPALLAEVRRLRNATEDTQFVELCAGRVHQAYLATCARLGWEVKTANQVPYEELSEGSKELDRASVRAVLATLREGER